MAVKFNATQKENAIIQQIAERAVRMARTHDLPDYDIVDAAMDIMATHCNGNRLRLEELRDSADFNFGHDVFGIRKYLNRTTGKLENFFVPRYSAGTRQAKQRTASTNHLPA